MAKKKSTNTKTIQLKGFQKLEDQDKAEQDLRAVSLLSRLSFTSKLPCIAKETDENRAQREKDRTRRKKAHSCQKQFHDEGVYEQLCRTHGQVKEAYEALASHEKKFRKEEEEKGITPGKVNEMIGLGTLEKKLSPEQQEIRSLFHHEESDIFRAYDGIVLRAVEAREIPGYTTEISAKQDNSEYAIVARNVESGDALTIKVSLGTRSSASRELYDTSFSPKIEVQYTTEKDNAGKIIAVTGSDLTKKSGKQSETKAYECVNAFFAKVQQSKETSPSELEDIACAQLNDA